MIPYNAEIHRQSLARERREAGWPTVDPNAFKRPVFEHVDNLPSKPRRTPILDYLKGWISPPPFPKADKMAIYGLELDLGYEPTERPPASPALTYHERYGFSRGGYWQEANISPRACTE